MQPAPAYDFPPQYYTGASPKWVVVYGWLGGGWVNMGSAWEGYGGEVLPQQTWAKTGGPYVYVDVFDPDTGHWSGYYYQPPPPPPAPGPGPGPAPGPLPIPENVVSQADNGKSVSIGNGAVLTVQLPSLI